MVAAIREIVETPAHGGPSPRTIALGIGDDAAVWQPSRSHRSVITTDALVDGVHFRADLMSGRDVGHRAMAASLSDAAAMGARPRLAVVALGMTASASREWILDAYRGMQALAAAHGTSIAGGDIVRAPALSLTVTLVGEVATTRLKRRDGGRPGDVLAVTGPLGASRAGLQILLGAPAVDTAVRGRALAAFATPLPRVREGRWLAASRNVHAMMDCSDGLSTDVTRLARASGCGAVVDDVPIAAEAQAVAVAAGADPASYALDGGEDFELLIAVGARAYPRLARAFEQRFGRPLLAFGQLRAGSEIVRAGAGGERALVAAGWDHLARG